MTIIIGIGKWGGIWASRHHLCLGFIAFHWYAQEDAEFLNWILKVDDKLQKCKDLLLEAAAYIETPDMDDPVLVKARDEILKKIDEALKE